ncbi:tetratricopeptide repeat protein [Novosphingobium sp.]|uniref:surface lipoprotein assembly modifier n=1 Tax=Novosphingobium sp. TaxID=1874826 RepID=UPI00333F5339
MKRSTSGLCRPSSGVLALLLLGTGIPVMAQTVSPVPANPTVSNNPLVAQALQQLRSGQAAAAYALLRPHLADMAGDSDYDYALGLAAIDSGHVPDAILAFQRVLAARPDQAQARAELARAYALSGDIETARREFDTVAGDATIPDPVRQRFTGLVQRLDRTLQPGSNLTGYAELGGGYDSNVNAATSAGQLVIPVFAFLGPATLSADARSHGDGFGSLGGGLSEDYGFNRQSHVFASVLAASRINGSVGRLNQTFATGTLGYGYTAANHDVASISVQTQQFVLGSNHYRSAWGAIAQYSHRLPGGAVLSGEVEAFDITYPTDRLRNARRYGGGVTYVDHSLYLGVQGGHEQTRNQASDNLSNGYFGVRGAYEYRLAPKISAFVQLAFEARRHDATDPLFLVRRHDDQFDATVGLHVAVLAHVTLNPQVGYTRNSSNIAIDDYTRVTGSITARLEF